MFKRTSALLRTPDRLSYGWLALAAALFVFSGGPWVIPLAAWLGPLFLLRFVRTQPLFLGLLLAWLVKSAVAMVVLRGIVLVAGPGYYALVALLTLVTLLPYLADRLIAPQLKGFSATLVFPVTFTALEYLASFGPLGTMTSIAYTQYGDLPLMQLVSVTGIWGISFLIAWFAEVVNWAWERGFAWPRVRMGGLLYAGILALVLLTGGARLAFFPPDAATVRVAGLSATPAAVAAFEQQLPPATAALLVSGKATQADRSVARSAFALLDNNLLQRSLQEARAGAKIIVWPEASPTSALILQEDEPALMRQATALAQQEGIYLDMGLGVYLTNDNPAPYVKDESVLVDPTGQMWTYEKTHLVPFGEQGILVPGDGKVPLVASPYGRLATVICFDQDFPAIMRQAGQGGADLMLAPTHDWQAIDPMHTQHAVFRAIEDGFSLVHEAGDGLSIATDYEGHAVASTDYFTTSDQIMVAYVPVHGVRTIYAAIGDLFAWLCLLGLAALVALAILRRRTRPLAAAADQPLPAATAAR